MHEYISIYYESNYLDWWYSNMKFWEYSATATFYIVQLKQQNIMRSNVTISRALNNFPFFINTFYILLSADWIREIGKY